MENKKYYSIANILTKRLLAVGIASLAIAVLFLWASIIIYQQSVAEHIVNEKCFQDPNTIGWCRVTFEKEFERDSIITATFGGGFVIVGATALFGWNKRSSATTSWKSLLSMTSSLIICYGLYYLIFSASAVYYPNPFYFLQG